MYVLNDSLQPTIQGLSTLSRLDLNEPFTYVETFSSPAPDCATDPATITEWRIAYIHDKTYDALPTSYTLRIATDTFYVTYVYPGFILTILQPGDVIYQITGECYRECVHPVILLRHRCLRLQSQFWTIVGNGVESATLT